MNRCSVAQIGGLPYRRLLTGEALQLRAGSGLATFATRSTFARNDAAETSNHLRAGEPAATRGFAFRSRIPTGFRPKAQGCEARATWVIVNPSSPTATRLRPICSRPHA